MDLRRFSVGALALVSVLSLTVPSAAAPIDLEQSPTSSGSVSYVRWAITAVRNPGEGYVQVAELVLFNGEDQLPNRAADTSIVVTNPAGINPGGEGPENVYDGTSSTKWLDNAFADDSLSSLVIYFPEPVTFDRYQWVTANDSNNRDPISWRLEVSTDGVDWTTVDTRSDVEVTTDRFSVVGPFDLAPATGRDFGTGRSEGAKSGKSDNRDSILALEPRSRGRVK